MPAHDHAVKSQRSVLGLSLSLLQAHATRRSFVAVEVCRHFCRALAVLLVMLVVASSCGGDEESASEEDSEQAQDLEQLLESEDTQETQELQERPAVPLWPHCANYEALLAAIAQADSAESAVESAREDLEDAEAAYRAADAANDDVGRFEADTSRLDALIALGDADAARNDAVRGFESAADAAVASAEALVADTTADDDARSAARRAVEVYAAAVDAANFAFSDRSSVGLGTPTYDAAYESALAAALGAAPPGRVTAEARVAAAESAARGANRLLEEAPAAEAAAWAAAAEAEAAAAAAEAEAEAAAYADAEQAAAAALAKANMQAAVLEAIASISVAVGEADSYRADVAFQAAWEPAYNAAEDNITYYDDEAAGWIANAAARDAAYAAQAALVVRLDALAERAGLEADLTSAHQAAVSAWISAWALAEDADWVNRLDVSSFYRQYVDEFDRASELVFDRQPAYDDLAYRAAARAVRTAVADSVPSSESVAAAEEEDVHWAVGGTAHRAFVAVRDRIATARAPQRGRIHPGTDGIAWDAYHVALDLLESAARAEAADIRADAATPRIVIDIESDPRVVQTRTAAERSVAAATEAQAAANRAHEAARQAEAELAEAQAALDATRPPYDRAVRAAWQAVAAEAGCR